MYFFQTWSRPPVPGKSQEMLYLDVLPGIFAEAPASSAIHEAIVALAFRIFANAHRSDDLSDHATMRYGSTLRQLGKELVRSNQIKDDTLATVLLLMLYEVCAMWCLQCFPGSRLNRQLVFPKRQQWELHQAYERSCYAPPSAWAGQLQQRQSHQDSSCHSSTNCT